MIPFFKIPELEKTVKNLQTYADFFARISAPALRLPTPPSAVSSQPCPNFHALGLEATKVLVVRTTNDELQSLPVVNPASWRGSPERNAKNRGKSAGAFVNATIEVSLKRVDKRSRESVRLTEFQAGCAPLSLLTKILEQGEKDYEIAQELWGFLSSDPIYADNYLAIDHGWLVDLRDGAVLDRDLDYRHASRMVGELGLDARLVYEKWSSKLGVKLNWNMPSLTISPVFHYVAAKTKGELVVIPASGKTKWGDSYPARILPHDLSPYFSKSSTKSRYLLSEQSPTSGYAEYKLILPPMNSESERLQEEYYAINGESVTGEAPEELSLLSTETLSKLSLKTKQEILNFTWGSYDFPYGVSIEDPPLEAFGYLFWLFKMGLLDLSRDGDYEIGTRKQLSRVLTEQFGEWWDD